MNTIPQRSVRTRFIRKKVVPSEAAARLLAQIPQFSEMPVLPSEQIDEVANQVRKRLKQRVHQAQIDEWRRKQEEIEKTGREEIAPGLIGVLTEVTEQSEKVHFFEIRVNGQRFFGLDAFKPLLQKYLDTVADDAVDVTFLHSSRIPIEKTDKRKGKHAQEPKSVKRELVDINCTVRVPKAMAMSALEDKIMRVREIAELGMRIEERIQREKAAQTATAGLVDGPKAADLQ